LTIVCPFTEEVSEPVQRRRAVRWRVIRFFRDCEDVPIILGLVSFVFVVTIIWLFLSWSYGSESWDRVASLDDLILTWPVLPLDFGDEISWLAAP
jgi:hypothetical protein